MKDEIKEILDKLNNSAEHYILYDYEAKILLDYITNLQEKYERMKENAETLSNGCNELEQRNEKAIEYIEYQISQLDFEKDIKAKMLGSMVLVLLQGSDE